MLILIQAESGVALPNEAHTHHECSRVHDLLLDELLPEKPHHVVVPASRGGSVSGHLIRQHLINRVKTIGDGNIGFVSQSTSSGRAKIARVTDASGAQKPANT